MPMVCSRCNRPVTGRKEDVCTHGNGPIKAVWVRHAFYGCDTGCCGHEVVTQYENGKYSYQFEFAHPYMEDPDVFVAHMIQQGLLPYLDKEKCEVRDGDKC